MLWFGGSLPCEARARTMAEESKGGAQEDVVHLPLPPDEPVRMAPITVHEPVRRTGSIHDDDSDLDHDEHDEEDDEHEDDPSKFTVPASMQKEMLAEMQRAQEGEACYHDAGALMLCNIGVQMIMSLPLPVLKPPPPLTHTTSNPSPLD